MFIINKLNLFNFNTNNISNMSVMFSGCLNELKNKIKIKK